MAMTTDPNAACRLAVDIGGTFTDAVLEAGGVKITQKVLTTPANPAEGFMAAVEQVLAAGEIAPGAVDSPCNIFRKASRCSEVARSLGTTTADLGE